ncbi:hypothetical protein ABLB69_20450, partial [Xenorhabdus khoisanae]
MEKNNGARTSSKTVAKTAEPASPKKHDTNIVPPKPNSPLPQKVRADSPTGEGNTLGSIVGQAPQTAKSPHEANAAVTPETKTEKSAWESVKAMGKALGNAVVDKAKETKQDLSTVSGWNPIEQQKGIAKSANNTAVGLAEMSVKGGMLNASREMDESANSLAFWGKVFGNSDAEKQAKVIGEIADANRTNASQFNLDEYKMTLDTPGQRVGGTMFDIAMLIGPVKGGGAAGSVTKSTEIAKVAEAGAMLEKTSEAA